MTLLRDGSLLVIGGRSSSSPNASTATVERYVPGAKQAVELGSLITGRENHTATLLADGSVLVVAGKIGGRRYDHELGLDTIERYDVSRGQSSASGSLAQARHHHTASLLPNGEILILGGIDTYGAADSALSPRSVEVYDPRTNKVRLLGNAVLQRNQHTATPLPDGSILILGGGSCGASPRYIVQDKDGKFVREVDDSEAEIFQP